MALASASAWGSAAGSVLLAAATAWALMQVEMATVLGAMAVEVATVLGAMAVEWNTAMKRERLCKFSYASGGE